MSEALVMLDKIEEMNDDELKILTSQIELTQLLAPIQNNNRKYAQYTKLLGRLDLKKNSHLQTYLPKVALRLVKQKDPMYVKKYDKVAQDLRDSISSRFLEKLGEGFSLNDIINYSIEELQNLLNKLITDENDKEKELETIWLGMKLNDLTFSSEYKDELFKVMLSKNNEIDTNSDSNIISEIHAEEEVEQHKEKVVIKKKVSKTPKEKAEQSKRALEKRLQEKQALQEKSQQQENEFIELEDIKDEDISEMKIIINQVNIEDNSKMKKLIGKIDVYNTFYNLTPIAEIEGDNIYSLTESDLDALLPKSVKRNINLYYSPYVADQVTFMQERFGNDQLVVCSFDIDELEENITNGTLNPTGYKLPALDYYSEGKITYLYDEEVYQLFSIDDLLDDIYTQKMVRIDHPDIIDTSRVLINLKNGTYAGPFKVMYRSTANSYCIQPRDNQLKYLIKGYSSKDCKKFVIENELSSWPSDYGTFYSIRKEAVQSYHDVITDEELIDAYIELMKNQAQQGEILSTEALLVANEESVFANKNIPEAIRADRIDRIKTILTNRQEAESVNSSMLDMVMEILLRNKDDERAEQIINGILESKPEIVDNVQSIKIIKEKIEALKSEIEQLEQEREVARNTVNIKNENEAKKEEAIFIEKSEALKKICGLLDVAENAIDLNRKVEELKNEEIYYSTHRTKLIEDTKNLESTFVELVNKYSEKIVDITFDGYMSSKMLQAAAQWENKGQEEKLHSIIERINAIESGISKEELLDYLFESVQLARPQYDKNTILNLFICSIQGFLTVLSGKPGCGKTSICNIISQVLGLSLFDEFMKNEDRSVSYNRYIPVSVERGWTSKRDFIGYYNPLTKSFEESNREIFDGLRILDYESREKMTNYPYFILLDEANLSPMEYYWADFMNVCDDQKHNHSINLGSDHVFDVPETLHFLATINNDHTTETLSPRLVDRAWIVTLPQNKNAEYGQGFELDDVKLVPWKLLKEVFISSGEKDTRMDMETQKIYDDIKRQLIPLDIYISPRVDIAINKYWRVASSIMEEDEYEISPNIIALDFAISQKVLPKIMGNGDEYKTNLSKLRDICATNNLLRSTDIMDSILSRGERQMKYYQFFA